MDNEFVETVRAAKIGRGKNTIKLPNQKDFNCFDWSNLFKSGHSKRTKADERLYRAGLWFHEHSKKIREELDQTFDDILTVGKNTNLLRLQVGIINHLVSNIITMYLKADNLNQLDIFNLSSEVENIITANGYVIDKIAQQQFKPPDQAVSDSEKLLNSLELATRLSCSYESLEYFWNQCLWSDWYINSDEAEDFLVPSNFDKEELYEINLLRWGTIFSCTSIIEWQSLTAKDKNRISAIPRISVKATNDHQKKIELYSFTASHDLTHPISADLAFQAFLKQDCYPKSIFNMPLPKLKKITLNQLIRAWRFISTMTIDVSAQFPKTNSKLTQSESLNFSPVFSYNSLIDLLLKSDQSLSKVQSSEILNLLTFRNARDDLWHRPLIKVNEDQFTVILAVLEGTPNPSRLVSGWMNSGGVSIDSKGTEFEQSAYRRLHEVNRLSNAEMYKSLKFKIGKKKEEKEQIDLILRIGQVIIICELKCTLFPYTPRQIYKYYEDLKYAAEQIQRKLSFVKDNLEHFLDRIGFTSQSTKPCQVIPLIISNLPLATGYAFQGISIIDLKILEDYLGTGIFTPYTQMSDPGINSLGSEIQLYSSEGEAEERIEICLKDLPHIQKHRQSMKRDFYPVHLVNQRDPIAFKIRFDVDLP